MVILQKMVLFVMLSNYKRGKLKFSFLDLSLIIFVTVIFC